MKNFLRKRQRGSILLLVVGSLAALSLFSMLMLSKYGQNARTVRTPASEIEMADLVQGIRQSVLDPTLCTQALNTYKYPRAETGSANTATTTITNGMKAVIGGKTVSIANQGSGTNGVSVAAAAQSLQIIGGPNYIDFGLQPPNAPFNVKNLNCQQADLHIVVAGQTTGAATQNFFGTSSTQLDIPITILTDANDNIQSCFGGSAATVCTQSSTASINSFTPATQCIAPGPANFAWTATNQSYVTINCTGPVPPSGNLTVSPATINFAAVPLGTTVTCTATAYNSAMQPSVPTLSATVNVEAMCAAPTVNISSSVACVDTGKTFVISWTDNDTDAAGVETFTSSGPPALPPGPFTPPVTPGGNSGPLLAPAAPTTLTYTISDTNVGGTGTWPTTVTVVSPPTFSPPLSVLPASVFSGKNVVFSYGTSNATSVTMTDCPKDSCNCQLSGGRLIA